MKISRNNQNKLKRSIKGSIIFFFLMLAWPYFSISARLNDVLIDFKMRHFMPDRTPSEKVVVIEIDDESLNILAQKGYGRWPWPRRIYKDLIEFIGVGEPRGIYFDLLFSESQQNGNDDLMLGEASDASKSVSHAAMLLSDVQSSQQKRELPKWEYMGEHHSIKFSQFTHHESKYAGGLTPVESILFKSPRMHIVNAKKESDGLHRRTPVYFNFNGAVYPSLSLRAFLDFLGNSPNIHETKKGLTLSRDEGANIHIPLDQERQLRIHYYPIHREVTRVPMAAVINSALRLASGEVQDPNQLEINPLEFEGKLVLIGASAAGLEDLKATPLHHSWPGVMVHATALSNLIDQSFIKILPGAYFSELFIALFIIVLTYLFAMLTHNALVGLLSSAAVFFLYAGISLWTFQRYSLEFPLAMPLTFFALAFLDTLIYRLVIENQESKRMQGTLGKFLPKSIVDEMINSGRDLKAEIGTTKELSVLFSDIRGFTNISEQLPPAEVVALLNKYLGEMTQSVFLSKGTLDKFIGDAVMAFWGAPIDDPQNVDHAVACALDMGIRLEKLKVQWKEAGNSIGAKLEIGIGINTGSMIVGNIGSDQKLDYTVIGDNVNLASRFEGLTKYYRVPLIIGELTFERYSDKELCRVVDLVRVKGKESAVRIFAPYPLSDLNLRGELVDFCRLFNQSWENYLKGNFQVALTGFKQICSFQNNSDPLCELYIERCLELLSKNIDISDWDGVFVAQFK